MAYAEDNLFFTDWDFVQPVGIYDLFCR